MKLTVLPPVQGQQYTVCFWFLPFALPPDPRHEELYLHSNKFPDPVTPFRPGTLAEHTEQLRPPGNRTYELQASPCWILPGPKQGPQRPL